MPNSPAEPPPLRPFRYHPHARAFIDAVTAAARLNAGNRLWWYTWLSSRDRLNVRAWRRFVEDDPAAGPSPSRMSPWLRLAKWAGWLTTWIAAAKLTVRRRALPEDVDVILISVMAASAVDDRGDYRSAFFGPLAAFLEARGLRVLHCGMVEGNPWRAVRSLAAAESWVTTFAEFLTFWDLARALYTALHNPLSVPPGRHSTAISDEFEWARADLLLGCLVESAAARLLARFASARIIHTYENNPWERACDLAAAANNRHVLGYLHAAVLPGHFKYFITAEERALRPAPMKVVCTGPEARRVLLSLGDHDPERVLVGCALRDGDLSTLPTGAASSQCICNVLVILEGLASMTDALRLLDAAAAKAPYLKIFVRAHPSLSLSNLVRHTKITLDAGRLRVAEGGPLVAAVQRADAVVYIGSTAALTAAYIGVPVIKLVLDETIEDDPLFSAPFPPPRIHSVEEFLAAIKGFELRDMKQATAELDANRAYLLDYLRPPSPEAMSAFLVHP